MRIFLKSWMTLETTVFFDHENRRFRWRKEDKVTRPATPSRSDVVLFLALEIAVGYFGCD